MKILRLLINFGIIAIFAIFFLGSCNYSLSKEDAEKVENLIDEGIEKIVNQNETDDNSEYEDLEIPVSKKRNKDEEIVRHLGYTTCYNTTL